MSRIPIRRQPSSGSVVSLLSGIPLFAALPEDDLKALAALMLRRSFSRGEIVFHEGDIGLGLYVVVEGEAKVVLRSTDGREAIIGYRGPGEFFGELALLDNEPRSANVVACEPSTFLLLRREEFLSFIQTHPSAAVSLLSVLSRRVRATTRILYDASFLDIRGRLLKVLEYVSMSKGIPGSDGGLVVANVTQGDLADLVGATRESVNKFVKQFERLGLLKWHRGRLEFPSPQRLSEEVRRTTEA